MAEKSKIEVSKKIENYVAYMFEHGLQENTYQLFAYFVNLPNAFVTYMLKFEQFQKMTIASTMAGIVTLCIIVVVFIVLVRANRKER